MNEQPYQPQDQVFLWWLAQPEQPILIGELNLLRTSLRGVSLRYHPSWLEQGFALSEDLPLFSQEFLPTEKDTAVGAVDDARPDRWGERVIRVIERPARLSLLEYLYFAGDDRFGALGVSTSADNYLPRTRGPLPCLEDTETIQDLVWKVLAQEPIPESQRRLISPGGTMGGARPKAIVEIDSEQWIVKFSAGEPIDMPLIEHACMTLASQANIRVSATRALRLSGGHAVGVQRFDRASGERLHALSAWVALKAAGEEMGYPELAQLLRRKGVTEADTNISHMRELFRRMVFNILIDNTDDHEKNHALLVNDAQQYELSPAFDVLPSGQALGMQQMRIGENHNDSTLENAMSMCNLFALTEDQAATQVREVIGVVDRWQAHFSAMGVTEGDRDLLIEQIDRPFLLQQRRAF